MLPGKGEVCVCVGGGGHNWSCPSLDTHVVESPKYFTNEINTKSWTVTVTV